MIANLPHRIAAAVACVVLMHGLAAHADTSATADPHPIVHFDIAHYEVHGNTLLADQDINQLLAAYTGKERDFGTVQQALEALELAYRKKGYELVRVILPEQELNHGVVNFTVVETRIGKVTVLGNNFFDESNIRASLPALQEGQTPDMTRMSAGLKLANEDPAKKTTLQLQSAGQSGIVDARLTVTDDNPWSASIAIDNTGDEVTGRNRLTATLQDANVGGLDHVLSVQYTTSMANPNEVNVAGAGYHIPLYTLGDSLDFYANYSNVNSGTVTAGIFDVAVSGSGTVAGGRYNHRLPKLGDYESTLTAGFDFKAFHNDETISGQPVGSDVDVHPVSLTYTGNWTRTASSTNFYLSALHNISGGANGSAADFAQARSGASATYSVLRFGGATMLALPADWQVRLALAGQLTSDALVQGEQFGAGGAGSVRGFSEREIADDKGRTTNLELYTANLCSGSTACRALGFYDTGYVARNDALPGEISQQSIASVGLGFRLTGGPHLQMQTDAAHVVDASTLTDKGSNRVHFKLIYTF